MSSVPAVTTSDKFLQDALGWAAKSMRNQSLNDANEAFRQFLLNAVSTAAFHSQSQELKLQQQQTAAAAGMQLPSELKEPLQNSKASDNGLKLSAVSPARSFMQVLLRQVGAR